MMKSFFKKLSLVMALAMVVSLVAPAGSAFAAEAGIAYQGTKTIVTEANVEIGADVADFCFLGAPADWKTTFKWTSDNETVATVDQAGKVTGLKDGVANITITAGADASYKHTVKVTVGAGEVEVAAFEVAQTNHTLATITFADKAITQADVEKNLSVEWVVVDDFKATQPFQVVSVKDGVAVINVYGFNDGVKYVFTYADAEPVVLDATIGEVASIEVKAYADAAHTAELEHIAYVGKDAYIVYTLKNAQGVDITDVALANNASAYVEFKLGTESTTGEYWLNDMTGTVASPEGKIYFTVANKNVSIIAKYVTGKFDSTTGLPVEGPQSNPYTVFSTYAPAYRIVSKTAFTLNGDFDHPSNVIALDDELTKGNTAVFKFKDSNKADVKSNVASAEGTFSFKSTVPSVAFVDATTGKITTNQTGTTTVLCYFKPNATVANPNPVATLVAAETITVAAKRAVSEIAPASRAVVVSTDAGFNSTTFTVNVKDQLGAAINASDIKVERNKATLPTGLVAPTVTIASAGEDGKYTVSVTGAPANVGEATSYLFTYEIKAKGAATQTFTVTVRQPIYNDQNNLVVSGYEIVTNNVTDIKTTDTNAKTLTANINVQSNAVSVFAQAVTKKPSQDYVAGQYYYTVTKDGTDITSKTSLSADNKTISIALTTISNGVVDKATMGKGNYVFTVYQAVGATTGATTQALSTIQTKTVTVTDSQKTVSYVAKNKAEVTNSTLENMVLEAYSFKYDNTTFGGNGTVKPATIRVTVDAKTPSTTLKSGDVVFVRKVTFAVDNGTGTYTTNVVTINDYITVK